LPSTQECPSGYKACVDDAKLLSDYSIDHITCILESESIDTCPITGIEVTFKQEDSKEIPSLVVSRNPTNLPLTTFEVDEQAPCVILN
jgi:hypothetical protein